MNERNPSGEPRRLYRSRINRKLAGVCGGIGEYFEVDPVLIRLLWILFTLAAGGGLLAYLIAWLVVPERPENL
jgi:phage shock protein C